MSTNKIVKAQNVLAHLAEVYPGMPVRQALAFLSVAHHEAVDKHATLEDVGHDTDSPSAVVSRDLLGLGVRRRNKDKPGFGLVESFTDYQDLRRKPYRLTRKGKALMKQITEAI